MDFSGAYRPALDSKPLARKRRALRGLTGASPAQQAAVGAGGAAGSRGGGGEGGAGRVAGRAPPGGRLKRAAAARSRAGGAACPPSTQAGGQAGHHPVLLLLLLPPPPPALEPLWSASARGKPPLRTRARACNFGQRERGRTPPPRGLGQRLACPPAKGGSGKWEKWEVGGGSGSGRVKALLRILLHGFT